MKDFVQSQPDLEHLVLLCSSLHTRSQYNSIMRSLRGQGGVSWVQIMENEFECLVVRWDDGGHFAEEFVKKYCF